MSPLAWIALAAYLLVWLVLCGGIIELDKNARAEGQTPKRAVWVACLLALGWPISLPLEAGRRLGKVQA